MDARFHEILIQLFSLNIKATLADRKEMIFLTRMMRPIDPLHIPATRVVIVASVSI